MTTINEEENIKEPDTVIYELITGAVVSGLLIQVVCLFLTRQALFLSIGLWCGVAIAVFWAIHMYRGIDSALSLPEGDAMKLMKYHAMLRYGAALVGMVVVYLLTKQLGNAFEIKYSPVMYVLGVLTLKTGAYMQPFIHGIYKKFHH